MEAKTISGAMFKKMFLAGAAALDAKKEYINELNVFPVPDGDTGTNMTMTIMSAATEVGNVQEDSIELICKAISSGSLRGARGNSGVILSQIFRGFNKVVAGEKEIDVPCLAQALQKASQTAYKAVMKPKQGTILTVSGAAAARAEELADTDISMTEFMARIVDTMQEALDATPDMLPVLKQAGVVDSGGEGLLTIVKGCYDAFLGKEPAVEISQLAKAPAISKQENKGQTANITYGYCTEFIVMLEKDKAEEEVEEALKEYLSGIGDSLVVVADAGIVKVHVHTNHPGQAFEKGLLYGSLSNMKVDNMRLEHQEKLIKDASKIAAGTMVKEQTVQVSESVLEDRSPRECGFVSVSAGKGLSDIFMGMGVDAVIQGGQTMNPSTEDICAAIGKVPAKTVFVFPNNSNIILAAEQAAKLIEDKDVYVVPSQNIPQGIAARVQYIEGRTPKENLDAMKEGMESVQCGQVTYAVRDTQMDGKDIKQGDYMGICDKSILAAGKELDTVTMELVAQMDTREAELISLYYGEDVTEEDAHKLADKLQERYEKQEVEVSYGGQPVYSYLISVE